MDDKKEKINVEPENEAVLEDKLGGDGTIKNIEWKEALPKIALGIMWGLFALLLGAAELPFGAVPFGIALLCAASSKIPYIYGGLCLSALFVDEGALVYFCAYTITLLIRALSRIIIDNPFDNPDTEEQNREIPHSLGDIAPLLFSEHVWLRMASASIGAFIIGIYTLASGGFYYYDLFGTIISMAAAPLAVYLYCGLAGKGGAIGPSRALGDEDVSDMRKFAALCAIIFSLILATRDIYIFGMSISLFCAMLSTLYFCRRGGMMYGIVAGTIAGLAYSPMLAPMFAFAAISSGALFGVSTFFACLSACTVSVAWALYSEGISALTSTLPGALLACLIFAVVEKLYLSELFAKKKTVEPIAPTVPEATVEEEVDEMAEPVVEQKCEIISRDKLNSMLLGATEQRIKVISEAFSSLSSLFYSLSEKTRTPAAADLRHICDNAFDSVCHSCKMRSKCWESEYTSSLASVSKICTALTKKGRITASDIPSRMLERCPAMPEIINQINRNCTTHTQQLIVGDKTEIFALDYEAISELLTASMTSQKEDFTYQSELCERACELIEEKKLEARSVLIYGNERKKNALVCFEDEDALYCNQKEIIATFEELLGAKLDFGIHGGKTLFMSSAKRFSVEYAQKSVRAKGEEGFCGDTVSIFENGRDNFYSFISDGMGSGREAALTSGICSVFLSKVLKATKRCDMSLTMLNEFLRNKGSGSMHECSATADLLEYDCLTGKADFYKGGAAPSYIFRNGNLLKLRSNTVPLGIIKELDARKISIDTAEGDIIIMVSDGVTQSREECPWLLELLKATVKKESLEIISEMIVNQAKLEGADDDISVVVMRVKAA